MKAKYSFFLLLALTFGCSMTQTSSRIRYAPASLEENQQAIKALQDCFGQGDCDVLLGNRLVCLPFLWAQVRGHPAVTNIVTKSRIEVEVASPNGGRRLVMMPNQLLQSREEVRAFWKAFTETIPLKSDYHIRKLTDEEKRIYNSMLTWPIEEPIFIVEGPDYRIMVQLVGKKGDAKLFFIDNYQDIHATTESAIERTLEVRP